MQASFKERLLYDKLSFYYISLPIILLGNVLGALLLSAIEFNVIDLRSIVIWLTVTLILFLYQLYHYYKFKNEPEENKLRDADIWLDKYYTNILLNGIVWGSAAFLLFPEHNLMNQMVVMLFLFAIGFSSMGVLASKKDLLLTYVMVTYTPLVARLFFMEDPLYTTIGYVVLALLLLMIIFANYYGNIINNSLNNRQHFITIKQTHEKLKERFFSLFERAPVGIYYYNKELELQDINTHFMQMNKAKEKEDLIGVNLHGLSNPHVIKAHKDVFQGKTGKYRGPFEVIHANSNLYVNLSTVPMMDTEGNIAGGICIVNDITNEITAKEQMIRNAYYDMLTKIPNRTLLMDKLKHFLSERKPHEEYAALLFLDIDNFKKVNETFGHHVGDHLLKQVVHRIEDIVGSREIFARVSGNKFVILIPSLHLDEERSRAMTEKYIETLKRHFLQPLNIADEEYHLTFTIGALLFNNNDIGAYDILKRAETAMYEAKKSAKGTVKFYESNMSIYAKEQLMLENEMHKAIKNDELTICYQPQIDVQTGALIAAEALVRWHHPEKGLIPPSKFIPVAEESGIIIKLEELIFEKIFRDIQEMIEKQGTFPLKHIAINVSTIHFLQPYFVERLMLLVQKYHINPEWIELELTESGIMENIKEAIHKINELKAFGFTFSIDDFGTGYSSLAYLKELPVDMIKIDQSFVMKMHKDIGDAMIVESVVSIGKKFHLKVLAEGVEDEEAIKHLKRIGCDYYQGNYAYKPLEFVTFKTLL
jgi:diguanylate cyclase (GGDEF)-like protein/PAS domain S-box-containing protein